MATFYKEFVSSGAETLTNQLSGTAVYTVGSSGTVKASFGASEGSNTATLKVRDTGQEIIPSGSAPNVQAAANTLGMDAQDFVYQASGLPSGANLDLEIVAAAAGTSMIAVIT
jgi:hypothetical protein